MRNSVFSSSRILGGSFRRKLATVSSGPRVFRSGAKGKAPETQRNQRGTVGEAGRRDQGSESGRVGTEEALNIGEGKETERQTSRPIIFCPSVVALYRVIGESRGCGSGGWVSVRGFPRMPLDGLEPGTFYFRSRRFLCSFAEQATLLDGSFAVRVSQSFDSPVSGGAPSPAPI